VEIILIRHGETIWNSEGRCQGFSDIALNERGKEQAKKIAYSLDQEDLVAIYSSPLQRAKETAEIIALQSRVPIFLEDDLKEINQGILEGIVYEDLKTKHKDILDKWQQDPSLVQLPQGECLQKVQERAWRCIERIVKKHSLDDKIIIVSHNLTIMTILCQILNLDLKYLSRLRKDVAAKTIIEFTASHPILVRLNDTSHLL